MGWKGITGLVVGWTGVTGPIERWKAVTAPVVGCKVVTVLAVGWKAVTGTAAGTTVAEARPPVLPCRADATRACALRRASATPMCLLQPPHTNISVPLGTAFTAWQYGHATWTGGVWR